MEVDCRQIVFVYDHIGERFRTEGNTCEANGNMLYINEDWIQMALRTNFLYDLQYQMYHEARHFYQGKVIKDFHERGKTYENAADILQWEKESTHYLRNEGTDETRQANATQKMEIDANAFAIVMLYIEGINEARAPMEQWQETAKRAQEIYDTLVIKNRIPKG